MRNETEDSVDLWRQVASAVEYIAAVERPGFTTWNAIADALRDWMLAEFDEDRVDGRIQESDALRTSIGRLIAMVPPIGAPGGNALADALSAAMADWLESFRTRADQGYEP
jgi:hypothetical protein